ncbi:hypothetical protein EMIT0P294_160069 [Pseudomonas sp. IT-P294]
MAGASERNDLGNVLQVEGIKPVGALIFLWEMFPAPEGRHPT